MSSFGRNNFNYPITLHTEQMPVFCCTESRMLGRKYPLKPGIRRKKDMRRGIEYSEVMLMLAAAWLMLSSLLYSLQLSTGSFPKPLTEEEEKYYLSRAAEGDLEARNILVERNLRLVAHIMNKG